MTNTIDHFLICKETSKDIFGRGEITSGKLYKIQLNQKWGDNIIALDDSGIWGVYHKSNFWDVDKTRELQLEKLGLVD